MDVLVVLLSKNQKTYSINENVFLGTKYVVLIFSNVLYDFGESNECPKIWVYRVPQNHPFWDGIFHERNHPAIEVPWIIFQGKPMNRRVSLLVKITPPGKQTVCY